MNTYYRATHPLHHNESSVQAKAKYDYWSVKSVVRPDEIVNFEIGIMTERNKKTPLKADVAGGWGLLILLARYQLMYRKCV